MFHYRIKRSLFNRIGYSSFTKLIHFIISCFHDQFCMRRQNNSILNSEKSYKDGIMKYFEENIVFRYVMNFKSFCKYINEKSTLNCQSAANIPCFISVAILTKSLMIWTNLTQYTLFETVRFSFFPTKNETMQSIFFSLYASHFSQ